MKLQLISFVALASIIACGGAPGAEDGTGSSSEAVSALPDLTGSYTGGSEAQFAAIELDPSTNTKGEYTYFLDEQGGIISCVVGKGCTLTHERETGYYSATATHLTLHPSNGAERVYSYVHTGTTLTLTRDGATGTYAQVESNCDTAADCPAEGLVHPDCASATSGWECSATHLCSYACSGAK
jgi:hypothetical protein